MEPKPAQFGPDYGAQFQDPSVASRYGYRPPYPDETFEIIERLLPDGGRVLDAGCGTGDLARNLVSARVSVDAVDASGEMIAAGRQRTNGEHPRLRWIHSPLESAPLHPPYDLITCGESLHWLDWEQAFARFADVSRPGALLVVVERWTRPPEWQTPFVELICRYSTNKHYTPRDLLDELGSRDLFQATGRSSTQSVAFAQQREAYLEAIHSRNGFSLDRMDPTRAAEFRSQLRALVEAHCPTDQITLQVGADLAWGPTSRPIEGSPASA